MAVCVREWPIVESASCLSLSGRSSYGHITHINDQSKWSEQVELRASCEPGPAQVINRMHAQWVTPDLCARTRKAFVRAPAEFGRKFSK